MTRAALGAGLGLEPLDLLANALDDGIGHVLREVNGQLPGDGGYGRLDPVEQFADDVFGIYADRKSVV